MNRLHPLTGVVRAFKYAWVGLGMPLFLLGMGSLLFGPSVVDALLTETLVLAAAGFVGGLLYGIGTYLRFRYAIHDAELLVHSGIVGRQRREIPLSRVQSVDLHRPGWGRLLGVTTLRIETAGGRRTEATLEFVGTEEAARLREVLHDRQAHKNRSAPVETGSTETDDTNADDTEILFTLGSRELLVYAATELRPATFVLTLLAVPLGENVAGAMLVPVLRAAGGPETLALSAMTGDELLVLVVVVLPLVLVGGWLFGAALSLLGYHGFTLGRRGDDLVFRRGLVSERSGTIPLRKRQTTAIVESVFQRLIGLAGLRIDTAGASVDQSDQDSGTAVPLADRDRIDEFVGAFEQTDPVTEFTRPPKRARRRYASRYAGIVAAITALAWIGAHFVETFTLWWVPTVLFLVVPPAAHYKWSHRGYRLADDHLVVRNGFWRRSTIYIPFDSVQRLDRTRSVFQRRLDLASVAVTTANAGVLGPQRLAVHDLPTVDAAILRDLLRGRSSTMIPRDRGR